MDIEQEYYEQNPNNPANPINSKACNYCIYSSYLFATNVLAALYFKQYLYAFLFLILTIASIIHHSSSTKLANIIDKISLYCVIFYGGYIFYNHYKCKCLGLSKNELDLDIKTIIKYIFIIITFLAVVYLYTFGYMTNDYVFHPEYKMAQMYHVLMHLVSSIGHHIIIAL